MEEIENKKFKFTELYYLFPRLINVSHNREEDENLITVNESPFGNCQTFTIAKAYKLITLDAKEIVDLFKEIYLKFDRKQVVIDIKDDYNDDVLNALSIITENMYSMPYISTNGSKMNLHVIQIDVKKLK